MTSFFGPTSRFARFLTIVMICWAGRVLGLIVTISFITSPYFYVIIAIFVCLMDFEGNQIFFYWGSKMVESLFSG